jgi:hypothetical protein
VGADVVDGRQADHGPAGVERLTYKRVVVGDVHGVQFPGVGHVRRDRPTRQRLRPVVRRRQVERAPVHEHRRDAEQFGDRPGTGHGR